MHDCGLSKKAYEDFDIRRSMKQCGNFMIFIFLLSLSSIWTNLLLYVALKILWYYLIVGTDLCSFTYWADGIINYGFASVVGF